MEGKHLAVRGWMVRETHESTVFTCNVGEEPCTVLAHRFFTLLNTVHLQGLDTFRNEKREK